ncbi:MAG: cupin domain-containing protein, partial [Burkholderiales bacterium]
MLGDIKPSEFLRDYWHKKPLLIRNAIPDFKGLLNPEELIELASMEEAQSRLVTFDRAKWSLENGPFEKRRFRKLPQCWTLLVQGVNHFLPEGAKLLGKFDFIPHARLDDLMVSFAPDGGGVGPHFDSYDVFLLQGMGSRRWQI